MLRWWGRRSRPRSSTNRSSRSSICIQYEVGRSYPTVLIRCSGYTAVYTWHYCSMGPTQEICIMCFDHADFLPAPSRRHEHELDPTDRECMCEEMLSSDGPLWVELSTSTLALPRKQENLSLSVCRVLVWRFSNTGIILLFLYLTQKLPYCRNGIALIYVPQDRYA